MLVHIWCAPTWRFHTELCKFLRNISTNICGLEQRADLKLGEVSSLFSSNKITISWLYPLLLPLNGFRFIFFYCVTVKTIYRKKESLKQSSGLLVDQEAIEKRAHKRNEHDWFPPVSSESALFNWLRCRELDKLDFRGASCSKHDKQTQNKRGFWFQFFNCFWWGFLFYIVNLIALQFWVWTLHLKVHKS